jgi:hypothetical protein
MYALCNSSGAFASASDIRVVSLTFMWAGCLVPIWMGDDIIRMIPHPVTSMAEMHGLCAKCPLMLPDLNLSRNVLTNFSKTLQFHKTV